MDFLHLVWEDNFRLHHLVGQCLPQVGKLNLIPRFQIRQVEKIGRPIPPPVPSQNTVGVPSSDGKAGLAEVGNPCCHMRIGSSQVDWHGKFQFGDGQHSEDFLIQPIICQTETGNFIGIHPGKSCLSLPEYLLVVACHVLPKLWVLLRHCGFHGWMIFPILVRWVLRITVTDLYTSQKSLGILLHFPVHHRTMEGWIQENPESEKEYQQGQNPHFPFPTPHTFPSSTGAAIGETTSESPEQQQRPQRPLPPAEDHTGTAVPSQIAFG